MSDLPVTLHGSAEAAIDADALLALRLLPDEPERAMRVHDETLRRAEAIGHERGLLRLRIVRLNERARRTGDRAALSEEMAQAARLAADRHWPVEALLLGLHRVSGLGFSAGLVEHRSEAPDAGFDLDEALRLADVALYAAKDAGRRRVVVANAGG